MKGIRKLLSLNLALIFLLSCFATAVPARAEEIPAAEPEQYIIIDGQKYDATQNFEVPSGKWKIIYESWEDRQVRLKLNGYTGGAIYSNINLIVDVAGDNIVVGDSTWGIRAEKELRLWDSYDQNGIRGTLTVTGGTGYSAISAGGKMNVDCPLTATGGNDYALVAPEISIWKSWPKKILVGNSSSDAKEESYSGQKYINISYIPYTLTLDGNGGATNDLPPKDNIDVTFTTGTPGYLHLRYYQDTFTKDASTLLGWTDNKDGSGTYHSRREEYKFREGSFADTVYALWEDENNKAVILNEYGDLSEYNLCTKVVPCKKGETFTLPESKKPGAIFNGWLAEDGVAVYPAGKQITVEESISFTAQYTPLILKIAEAEYPADVRQGHYSWGWEYQPSPFAADLHIYKNYPGGSIEVPCDVDLGLHGSLVGQAGKPAISVNGNLEIRVYDYRAEMDTDNPIKLTGGSGSPAVIADGNIGIDIYENDLDMQLLISSGGSDKPALSATGKIWVNEKVYSAGSDGEDLKPVGKYSDESYLSIKDAEKYSIRLSGTTTVPTVPENDMYIFYGWSESETWGQPTVWYKPSHTINAGAGKTLWANYFHINSGAFAVAIEGNGGKTSTGSKYLVTDVSADRLEPYRLPTSEFTYSGHTLKGYNTKEDGSGISYSKGQIIEDGGETRIRELYAQWQQDSGGTGDGGGGGGGGGGAALVDPIADAIKQAAKNGSVTLEPPSKGEGVTLTQEHIKQILDKSLSVEAKTETGSLKLSAETLATLAKEHDGKELKFTLGKADDADKMSVGGLFLNLSVSAGGKEIHDISGSAKIHLDGVGKGDVVTLVHYNADGTVKDVSFITVKESGLVEFQFDSLSYYSLLKRSETPAYLVFGDVGEKAWFGKAVSHAYQNKLFDGTSPTTFSPDMKMNREMFATVLYRLAGSPAFSGESTFSDVADSGAYYHSAILWCAQNGIINGYPDGRFGVGDLVTREQMVSMLYRYAKDYAKEDVTAGADDPLQTYTDAVDISKGAYEAFRWAVGAGVLRGATATEMLPQATATRAEVAQILMNYAQKK